MWSTPNGGTAIAALVDLGRDVEEEEEEAGRPGSGRAYAALAVVGAAAVLAATPALVAVVGAAGGPAVVFAFVGGLAAVVGGVKLAALAWGLAAAVD